MLDNSQSFQLIIGNPPVNTSGLIPGQLEWNTNLSIWKERPNKADIRPPVTRGSITVLPLLPTLSPSRSSYHGMDISSVIKIRRQALSRPGSFLGKVVITFCSIERGLLNVSASTFQSIWA